MKKEENSDWISKDNSTFKMVNGKPVMVEEKPKNTIGFKYVVALLSITLFLVFIFTSSKDTNNSPSEVTVKKTDQLQSAATPAPLSIDFKDIKVTTNIDWNTKKDNLTKYVVTVENNSNKTFSGKVSITPTTSRVIDSFDIDIPQLLPKEIKTIFSFAEIKSNTNFEYGIRGGFTEFNNKTALDYKAIKTIQGNGYMTFWIYTPNSSKDNLIAISKEMKIQYSSLKIGFQIRFFNKENPSDMAENIAAYALTNHLKLTKLTIFKNDEEINID